MKMHLLPALLALALPVAAQQPFDLNSLNRLDAKSKNRTNISLDGSLLKLAAGFLDMSGDKDAAQLKTLVGNLTGVYVRGYEFDKEGQYSEADLEPLRAVLRQPSWSRIVDVHEGREASEIWVAQSPAGDKFSGVAILDIEPRELTVVYISGLIGAEDLARLNGRFGINVDALDNAKISPNAGRKSDRKTEKKKQEDQQ